MKFARPTLASALFALLLLATTCAVYWPVRHHDFVSYDDPEYVTGNQIVQAGLTWPGVKWAFTTGWTSYWHPLTWLSHMLDAELFGPSAAGPHGVNVVFHLANTLVLFGLLRRLTGSLRRSAFVAALFALHPLHVESVAWISERKDVLSAFFFLLTLWAYANYAKPPAERLAQAKGWYGGALLLFALGLMSKPMVVTLPCVLLLLDYWPLQRFRFEAPREFFPRLAPLLREKTPFFVLSALACVVTFLMQRQNGAVQSLAGLSLGERVENALVAYTSYLGKTFWPSKLAVFYPHPGHWPRGEVVLALVVVAGATGAAVWGRRRFPFLATGWFWFLGILVPAIGLVQVGDQAMADRYTYLSAIGVFLIFAWGGAEILARWRWPKIATGLAAGLIVAACAVRTGTQLRHWQDSESLFRHAVSVTEKNYVAHNNLGNALLEQGRVEEAIVQLETALKIRSDYAPPHNNLGMVFLQLGRPDDAIPHFRKALEAQPRFAEIHNNLGNALRQKGEVDAAVREYEKAVEIRPRLAVAHGNLGEILLQSGRPQNAIGPLRQALEIEPSDIKARGNLGLAFLQTGRMDEAIGELQTLLKLRPDYVEVRYQLALALFQNGRIEEAIADFQQVAAVQPGNAEVHNNLGWALLQRGQPDDAIAQFQTVLKIQPDAAVAYHNLAIAFLQKGQAREAIAHYRSFLELQPDDPHVLSDLAWLLATSPDASLRDSAQALTLAQHANQLSREDPMILRSLAAAYAEDRRFTEAVATARRACQFAEAQPQPDPALANDLRAQIKSYEAGSPLRDGRPFGPSVNATDRDRSDAASKNL